jgi:hypothetical protein
MLASELGETTRHQYGYKERVGEEEEEIKN